MESFDWHMSLKTNLRVLRCLGLWPKEEYRFDLYTAYALSSAIIIIGGHNIFQYIHIGFVYDDVETLTRIFFVAITNFVAATKMYFFVRNMGRIKNLFSILQSDQFRPRNLQQVDAIVPALKQQKRMYFGYIFVVFVIVSTWSFNPLFDGSYKNYQLPFDSWYPVDVEKSPNYEILYIYQLICIWPMSIGNISLDTLIFAVITYTHLQCEILCNDLKNLKGDNSYNSKLIACIKHHKAIISFAEDSNHFLSVIALAQMATSTSVLALSMFQLTLIGPANSEGFGLLIYILALIFQIHLYCGSGNRVEVKSSEIVQAIYESEWVEQSEEVKKNVLIFFIRCQRPIRMTAINLFMLSLETFIKIMRSAYSYYAVLSSVDS